MQSVQHCEHLVVHSQKSICGYKTPVFLPLEEQEALPAGGFPSFPHGLPEQIQQCLPKGLGASQSPHEL